MVARGVWRIGGRDVRAMLVVCIVAACCACASAAMAGTPPVPIEGTILVSADGDPLGIYFIRGTSDNRIPAPILFTRGEISPYTDRVSTVSSMPGRRRSPMSQRRRSMARISSISPRRPVWEG